MFVITDISFVLLVTTAVNLVIAYLGWQRRFTKGGPYFAWGALGVAIWTLASALDYAATELTHKILFAKIEVIGSFSALALYALLSFRMSAQIGGWKRNGFVRFLLYCHLGKRVVKPPHIPPGAIVLDSLMVSTLQLGSVKNCIRCWSNDTPAR